MSVCSLLHAAVIDHLRFGILIPWHAVTIFIRFSMVATKCDRLEKRRQRTKKIN